MVTCRMAIGSATAATVYRTAFQALRSHYGRVEIASLEIRINEKRGADEESLRRASVSSVLVFFRGDVTTCHSNETSSVIMKLRKNDNKPNDPGMSVSPRNR